MVTVLTIVTAIIIAVTLIGLISFGFGVARQGKTYQTRYGYLNKEPFSFLFHWWLYVGLGILKFVIWLLEVLKRLFIDSTA